MDEEIKKLFGNKVRIRVCGLCWRNDSLLMVNHRAITETSFWAPPGGGVEFGQSMEDSLIREFKEETGLDITVTKFQFIAEFIKPPLHAIEVFFAVDHTGGLLHPGTDPEMSPEKQIIQNVEFLDWNTINRIPQHEKHGILKDCRTKKDLLSLQGFYRI